MSELSGEEISPSPFGASVLAPLALLIRPHLIRPNLIPPGLPLSLEDVFSGHCC